MPAILAPSGPSCFDGCNDITLRAFDVPARPVPRHRRAANRIASSGDRPADRPVQREPFVMGAGSVFRILARSAVRAALLAAASMLAACAAGPNFKPPPTPAATRYTRQSLANPVATAGVPGGGAQAFETGADISGDWWTLFHSPALDALVTAALENNHDLKAAQAALKVAHEDVLAQRGSFLPAVSAGFGASRQHDPSAALAPVPSNNASEYSLFTPQLTISYAPDLFGLNR